MKPSIIYTTGIAACLCLLLTAYHKYLDVTPKGIVIPSTTAQYEGLLNSPTLTQVFSQELMYMSDDCYIITDTTNSNTQTNAYLWRAYINAEDQNSPAIWGNLYTAIYYTNVIINRVMDATDNATPARKQQLLGEALVIRAYCYMDLLSVFAKSYNASTAATDPGLPLVTSTDVGDKTPPRSTLQATLDSMISQVKLAAGYLPATNINKYRVTSYGAYGLLSRIYLYMADYTNAGKYADLALAAPHSLVNYNNYTAATAAAGFPGASVSPEVLWQRTSSNYTIPFQVLYAPELKNVYDSSIVYTAHPDLRYRYLSVLLNSGLGRNNPNGSYANFGITFPEMDLTKAEVLARANNAAGAMTIVNTLRKARIQTSAYADLTAANAADALTIVLAERRRELAFAGPRWFDMKRLDQDGRMPVVRRANLASGTTPYTLLDSLVPHSVKYTFQIPIRVQQFNPEMTINPR
ncbi:MAG: RagB/SusD family nutrient uptake outer membrane protein [Bacteroidetes bacterium]|nr:RagB/SusD family nutrient uptake outer membrane protein [Bacteroidota bacterium]